MPYIICRVVHVKDKVESLLWYQECGVCGSFLVKLIESKIQIYRNIIPTIGLIVKTNL